MKTNNYQALTVGTKLYYTGDVCNLPATYKIAQVIDDRFGRRYTLAEVNGNRKSQITPAQIDVPTNKGSRFYVHAEWKAQREQDLASMKAEVEAAQARRAAKVTA